MAFDYFDKLSDDDQAIYRASDAITELLLPSVAAAKPLVKELKESLVGEKTAAVQRACARLCQELCRQFKVEEVSVRVLASRPSSAEGELHGLYIREEGRRPRITVWMRTAKKGKVVAFKTFLRTLLHEILHHLDYSKFELAESFHTEGFFKRESHLQRQLLGTKAAEEKPPPKGQIGFGF